MMRIYFMSIAASLLIIINSSFASAPIGVIQYNVKGDSRSSHNGGIWSYHDPNERDKEVSLIADKIKSDNVDFVSLEQAIIDTKDGAMPKLSDLLAQHGITGWETKINDGQHASPDFDETEIAYDSHK